MICSGSAVQATARQDAEVLPVGATRTIELSIVMPCLNEAETVGTCIRKAQRYLADAGITGEIVVADNGSTDGSRDIAVELGARIVDVSTRGYGAALWAGITAARGRFIIMGDSDDSYDFSKLDPFVRGLRDGYDIVMGDRFAGGIEPGAMPALHRYFGTPAISGLGRLLFGVPSRDFNCGLRGFVREKVLGLKLQARGMEFVSEMIVRGAIGGLRMTTVPTALKKDGRSRPPHLRTWRDGWRNLRFMLLFSPRWLYLYPGLALIAAGLLLTLLLLPGPLVIGRGVTLDMRSLYVASVMVLVGTQSVTFGVIARRYAAAQGFLPPVATMKNVVAAFTLERMLLVGLALVVLGAAGIGSAVAIWGARDFGLLDDARVTRLLIASATLIGVGVQLGLSGFIVSLMEIEPRR